MNRDTEMKQQSKRRGSTSRCVVQVSIWLSLMATVLLVVGFGYGAYVGFGGTAAGNSVKPGQVPTRAEPSANTKSGKPGSVNTQSNTIHLVVLGDSLAQGFGDASGNGFAGDVAADYRHEGKRVVMTNLGIDGLTSSGLRNQLQQASVRQAVTPASVILLSIGGNDLNNAAGLPALNLHKITTAQRQFHTNLAAILQQLRSWNQTAPILLVGLYNPYENVTAQRQQTNAVVESWNFMEDTVAAKFSNTIVVRTFDLFELGGGKYLYADHFHPNQTGYARIAARIWQDLQGVG